MPLNLFFRSKELQERRGNQSLSILHVRRFQLETNHWVMQAFPQHKELSITYAHPNSFQIIRVNRPCLLGSITRFCFAHALNFQGAIVKNTMHTFQGRILGCEAQFLNDI